MSSIEELHVCHSMSSLAEAVQRLLSCTLVLSCMLVEVLMIIKAACMSLFDLVGGRPTSQGSQPGRRPNF